MWLCQLPTVRILRSSPIHHARRAGETMGTVEISQLRRRAESNFKSAIDSLKRVLPKEKRSRLYGPDCIRIGDIETEAARLERYMEEVIQIRTTARPHNKTKVVPAKRRR